MAFLITASLYNAYRYYAENPISSVSAENDKQAYDDFLRVLRKEPTPTTDAIQKGIDFENDIFNMTNRGIKSEDACVCEIANIVKGGLWQQIVQKRVGDYLLYGKADVIKERKIYDIKRTGSYDIGKYKDSIQHLLYMECTPIEDFDYLIGDGKAVYIESYHKDIDNQKTLIGKINNMVNFIKQTPEFWDAFVKNWTAKG